MPIRFAGFPQQGLDFLRKLKRNNRREWFQPRKHIFDEKVKAPMVELVTAVNAALMRVAPGYVTEPAGAIYRFYRDTRFSPDKSPYKDHIAANFPRRGFPKHSCAGFYFSVAADALEVAGGVYMPGPDELRGIRTHIAANATGFRRLIASRSLRALMGDLQGDQLSRVPKGFACDDPAADLIRYKQWLFYVILEAGIAATPQVVDEIVHRFKAMAPFCDFLNAPLVPARRAAIAERVFLE